MKTHWTNRSLEDYIFSIATDFIVQLENKMEDMGLSQDELAKRMGRTKGRISQVLNNPGNFKLLTAVEYSKALNMKVAIVAYEDNDPEGESGPINSEIFKICWEKMGKPKDFWAFQEASKRSIQDHYDYMPLQIVRADNRNTITESRGIGTSVANQIPGIVIGNVAVKI